MLELILVLIIIGVALYFINKIPMNETVKQLINALGIIIAVFLILRVLLGLPLPLRI